MVEWNGVRYDEFILPEKLEAIRRAIQKPGVVIVYGPQGTGKTTAVYLVALKEGYKVIEIEADLFKNKTERELLYKELQMKSLFKKVYLYDYAGDNLPTKVIEKIAKITKHPFVVITPTMPSLHSDVLPLVSTVQFPQLSRRQIVEYLRKRFGPDIDVSKITSDLRQSIEALKYGGTPATCEDIFSELDKIFSGNEPTQWDNVYWIWILEHIDNFFHGRKLFEAVRIMSNANLYSEPRLLKAFKYLQPLSPMYVKYRYPYFFVRAKAVKGEENEQ